MSNFFFSPLIIIRARCSCLVIKFCGQFKWNARSVARSRFTQLYINTNTNTRYFCIVIIEENVANVEDAKNQKINATTYLIPSEAHSQYLFY